MKLCQKGLVLVLLFLTSIGVDAVSEVQVPELTEESLSLSWLIEEALETHPELKSLRASASALEARAQSQWAPSPPSIGYQQSSGGMMDGMKVWTVSQMFKFPVKYFLDSAIDRGLGEVKGFEVQQAQWNVVAEIKNTYYALYVNQKLQELKEANIKTVREFARIAERKYAAGTGPQQDSMRAHVGLTRLEVEKLELSSREQELQQQLQALLNYQLKESLQLGARRLSPPRVNQEVFGLLKSERVQVAQSAPSVKVEQAQVEVAETKQSRASWDFAPDFALMYEERMAGPHKNSVSMYESMYSLSVTVPLWFWGPERRLAASRAEKAAQRSRLEMRQNSVLSRLSALESRVETLKKTLTIYETSLIPQAETAFTLSAAAYRSGGGTFLEFLESEKEFFEVREGYLKTLGNFVESLARLEALTGRTLADWEG